MSECDGKNVVPGPPICCDRCQDCIFADAYVALDDPQDTLLICSGDVDEEDGATILHEVSKFDASDCMMWKKK